MRAIARFFWSRIAFGLVALLPLILALAVLRFAFGFLDGLVGPAIDRATGRDIPGVGVAALLVVLLVVGMLGLSPQARRFGSAMEGRVVTVPGIGTIYGIGRKIASSLTGSGSEGGFTRVVVVEYPRDGVYSLGFLTGFVEKDGAPHAFVYLPTAPMPNSGWIAVFPVGQIWDTDLSSGEAMELVLSSGISHPMAFATRRVSPELGGGTMEKG